MNAKQVELTQEGRGHRTNPRTHHYDSQTMSQHRGADQLMSQERTTKESIKASQAKSSSAAARMPLLDKAARRARKRESLRTCGGKPLKRGRQNREIGIRSSRETAERPYKKRMECDQAKMI